MPSTILIVEDEFLIAMELLAMVEDGGYEVTGPVVSVAAALAQLEQQVPSACVLDVNLRGENSAPVAVALKRLGVPFLLSSAYSADTLEQYPAFKGIMNIGKPAPQKRLLAALAELVPNRD